MTHRAEDLHRDRRAGLVPGFAAYDRRQAAHETSATEGAPAKAPVKKAPAKKAPAKKAAAKKAAR